MGSTLGRMLRVTTFGESHGPAVGAVVDGFPPGLSIDLEGVQRALDRRAPGRSPLASNRKEPDRVELLSGVHDGRSLGTPIAMMVRNVDADASAYRDLQSVYRPSHADFTTVARYGLRDWRGGGRASARETVGRVLAGALAEQALHQLLGVEIVAWVDQVGALRAKVDLETVRRTQVDARDVRCPDALVADEMDALIRQVRAEKDTVGGVVGCVCRGVPAGLGAPVFDKLEAELAGAMLSLPAAKGFESGTGFAAASMRGSKHNDPFVPDARLATGIGTSTNHSGGIQGGISNGMPVWFKVAFKPVATIFLEQQSVDVAGQPTTLLPRGRHDPCVVPRAVPIVEAMAALVLLDHLLLWRGQVGH
jgi:chorismate synthase